MDRRNLKKSTKGSNFQTAKLIRSGYAPGKANTIVQQGEEMAIIAKKAKRRQRLGM